MIDYQYLAGGLTSEPEIRFTPNGKAVTSFTLAQSDSKKNDSGQWETTNNRYVPITIWDTDRTQWSQILPSLQKGTKLAVQGKLITRQWEAQDGSNRSRLEFLAFDVYVDASAGRTPQSQQQQQQPTGWVAQDQRGGFAPKDEKEHGLSLTTPATEAFPPF